jgi:hypothetical protein
MQCMQLPVSLRFTCTFLTAENESLSTGIVLRFSHLLLVLLLLRAAAVKLLLNEAVHEVVLQSTAAYSQTTD